MAIVKMIHIWIEKNGGLSYPSGLCYDKERSQLYISDMRNRRIVKYNMETKEMASLPTISDFHNRCLETPLALTICNGSLIVTDAGHNQLFVFSGEVWKKVKFLNELTPAIHIPGSVACDAVGNIYFTDFLNSRICKIDLAGALTVIHQIKCVKPYGICMDQNVLYITDTENNQILWFDTVKEYGGALTEDHPPKLLQPIAVAADDHYVFICESRRIILFDKQKRQYEVLLNKEIWQSHGFGRIGYAGAIAPISKGRVVFSDTIKSCIYELIFE